jgi:hypothetical protein
VVGFLFSLPDWRLLAVLLLRDSFLFAMEVSPSRRDGVEWDATAQFRVASGACASDFIPGDFRSIEFKTGLIPRGWLPEEQLQILRYAQDDRMWEVRMTGCGRLSVGGSQLNRKVRG